MRRDQSSFGAIVFDTEGDGEGWACESGQLPVRVTSALSVGTGVLYWTSLSYQAAFQAKLHKNAWIRNERYLRSTQRSIIDEWGVADFADESIASFLANIFKRLGTEIGRYCGGRLTAPVANQEFGKVLQAPFWFEGEVGEAISQAVQEWAKVNTHSPAGKATSYKVVLPRLPHSEYLLSVPEPVGPWTWVDGDRLPQGREGVAWAQQSDRPLLLKVRIKDVAPHLADAFAFGDGATDLQNRPRQRNFVAHPEFIVLSEIADFEICGAFVGKEYRPSPVFAEHGTKTLFDPYFSAIAENSWSVGLIAENLWTAHAGKERTFKHLKPGATNKVSARSAWVRSTDKAELFPRAVRLIEAGFNVFGYGAGSISVSVEKGREQDFARACFHLGLMPPRSVTADNGFFITPEQWGGGGSSYLAALVRASGHFDLMYKLDGVPWMERSKGELVIREVTDELLKRYTEGAVE